MIFIPNVAIWFGVVDRINGTPSGKKEKLKIVASFRHEAMQFHTMLGVIRA